MGISSTRYLDKLASLRFFAAFLVVIYHLGSEIGNQQRTLAAILTPIADYGFVGVSIFFVLSGFVISHANDRWKGWDIYLAGRVTRIYPPHLIVTFALMMPDVILLITQGGADGWLKLLSNFSLTQAWSSNPGYFRSLNLVTWSLSVEMSFYVAFIALRRLGDRWLLALTAIAYLVLLVITLYLRHIHHDRWTFYVYWQLYINPVARLPEFLVGMSIYRLYRVGKLPHLWVPRFNFLLTLAALMAALYLAGTYGGMGGTFAELLDYSVVPLPFIVLMMIALLDERSNVWMHNRNLVLLGESSFALYLLHRLLIGYLNEPLHNAGLGSNWLMLLALMIFIAVPVATSVLFYRFIELPLTRALRYHLVPRNV
ncbi:MAG TPA: acyltransferase [Gammaproteobacteria bacterium]|nr:acyltransferase [Gammaproteobacteria bacterium]